MDAFDTVTVVIEEHRILAFTLPGERINRERASEKCKAEFSNSTVTLFVRFRHRVK